MLDALAEGRAALLGALGLEAGGAALCELYSAPLSHGAALSPEIRRFQASFDRLPEERQIRMAHAQLHSMEREVEQARDGLTALEGTAPPTDDIAAMALSLIQRGRELGERREYARAAAEKEAASERETFEQAMAERREAADQTTQQLRAELEARRRRPAGFTVQR